MRAQDLQSELTRRPFQPFRIRMTDETTYEVLHPELVVPGRSSVIILVPHPDEQDRRIYDRYHVISYFHIVRLETLPETSAPRGSNGEPS